MGNLKNIFLICIYNLKKWPSNARIYLVFFSVFLYLHSILLPISDFCLKSGYSITPYLFPFIMSDSNSVLLFTLGIVLLLCDAPFIEEDQPYIILRSGRKLWTLGQMLYMCLATFLYFAFIIIMSLIILLPYLEFSLDWGKVIGTFAQTSVAPQHNITIPFSFYIFNSYKPLAALSISFLNCWLVSFVLGLLMFLLNLNFSRFVGILISSILIFWQVVVTKTWTGFTKYSPVTWLSLSRIDTTSSTLYPTLQYIYIVIIISILILVALCLRSMNTQDINTLKSI